MVDKGIISLVHKYFLQLMRKNKSSNTVEKRAENINYSLLPYCTCTKTGKRLLNK